MLQCQIIQVQIDYYYFVIRANIYIIMSFQDFKTPVPPRSSEISETDDDANRKSQSSNDMQESDGQSRYSNKSRRSSEGILLIFSTMFRLHLSSMLCISQYNDVVTTAYILLICHSLGHDT